jgi:hypothetical protein
MNTEEIKTINIEVNTEVATKRGRGRPKTHTDVPSHLVCSVTGKSVKTTPVQFRKQLEKSGLDRETFLKTYVSRAGKRTAFINELAKL